MPLKSLNVPLLIHEPWLYELSSLRAADRPLEKHSNQVYYLNHTILENEVGRCFVELIEAAKHKADAMQRQGGAVTFSDSNGQTPSDQTNNVFAIPLSKTNPYGETLDWSDYLESFDLKIYRVLTNQDFSAWYAKSLEFLITEESGDGNLTTDGVVEVIRQNATDGIQTNHISAKKLDKRLTRLREKTRHLRMRMIDNCIMPNVLLFDCLKKFYDVSVDPWTKKPARPRRIYSEFVKGGTGLYPIYPVKEPVRIENTIEMQEKPIAEKSYKYQCDEYGGFAIDYSSDIEVMGTVEYRLVNEQNRQLASSEFDVDGNPMAEFVEITINNLNVHPENAKGTITIKVTP